MAKELKIMSIICFLSALIAACSRRLVIKTKRDSKRRDSSEGVKKRGKFGSSRVMFFTRADSTQPSSLFHFSAAFSPSTISFRFTNWTPATGYPLWFFFSFSTEDYFRIEYFVVIHDLYFQALSLLDFCILEYLFLWEYCALEIDGLVLNLHITLASDPTSFLRYVHTINTTFEKLTSMELAAHVFFLIK